MLKQLIRKNSKISKIFGKNALNIYQDKPVRMQSYIDGQWRDSQSYEQIVSPLNGKLMVEAPENNTEQEINLIVESMKQCPKSGLHNAFKKPQRYREWGDSIRKITEHLHDKEINDHFLKLIQMVMPKSEVQAQGELTVTRNFLENFCGDNSRFGLRGFQVAGDHEGQISNGYRFPYGPVSIITPFNFPYEIPILQTIGALLPGNKVLLKVDSKVSLVMEHFVRLMDYCGFPKDSLNLMHSSGPVMQEILERLKSTLRQNHFTGSSKIANKLNTIMDGKVSFEDSGFNWKVLGPDVGSQNQIDYVASQCDQDAYACGGQKCSAQSMLVVHENWLQTNLLDQLKEKSSKRNLKDLTNSPLLSINNQDIQKHQNNLLKIPRSKLLFGGKPIEEKHDIPSQYGSYQPTAVFIPFEEIIKPENHKLIATEIFGPFQIVTSFNDTQKSQLINLLESFDHHLTAGIISNDVHFVNYMIKNTVNGVTYVGKRGRTTGAPQNHWFGPSNDPRGSGIGTIEAIVHNWTSHREIVYDFGSDDGNMPKLEQS